ncbi:MAG: dihydrofolate reductase family protein, partial [Muribaculaceae bacterium]|nr:dihydrofolate reductase family protein [Muribaculaceae bacterium]
YGKTPPCAQLIIDKKIPRVVVGAVDPFSKVAGRGISMLQEAGIEVVTGVLAEESIALNKKFFAAHTLQRPYITLKWAQSSDGFMDSARSADGKPFKFSTSLGGVIVHRERALNDAILSTLATVEADGAQLNVRSFSGPSPRRVIVDVSVNPLELMAKLYSQGVTSVLVEAGPRFLNSMLEAEMWDCLRIETSPDILGECGRHTAPSIVIPSAVRITKSKIGNNTITVIERRSLT